MKKLIFLIPFLLFFGIAAHAQDPLEVGPDIYKKVFENDRVRVCEITFKVGAKIGMHSHPDHFVYVLNDGKLKLSYLDGSTKDFEGKKGELVWIPAETHSGENMGDTEFHALVVELKEKSPQV